jgi:UDP-N-acetylmuramate: L-alanyl-gamma-D-glutamyl-meso-diaminopimelate ligase
MKMKVHFIAIGGAVMHNMAIALKNKGYQVTGSDDEIFDPAHTNLENHGLLPPQYGWFPQRITNDLDAIIVGMHAKKGNPELDKAVEMGLKIYSFPEYLYEQSKDKKRIVVAGSHGKTTITSMIMHVLNHCDYDFDYLVGAKVEGFEVMVKLTDAPIIVIEGDEYLTSPLDRRPKFLHYKPDITLISGIAWDHINVFPDYEDYKKQFQLLIADTASTGALIYCSEDAELTETLKNALANGKYPSGIYAYNCPESFVQNGKTYLSASVNGRQIEIALKIFGQHNLLNLEGARLVCEQLGIDDKSFYQAITSFSGAARRLELIGSNSQTSIFKDFAHSPSKLKATVKAVKTQYPDRSLIAVMELHTYSSLSKEFLCQYRDSLNPADLPVVFYSRHAIELKKLPPISHNDIREGFNLHHLEIFTQASDLKDFLLQQDFSNTNLLMMTSGNFGGLDLNVLSKRITA